MPRKPRRRQSPYANLEAIERLARVQAAWDGGNDFEFLSHGEKALFRLRARELLTEVEARRGEVDALLAGPLGPTIEEIGVIWRAVFGSQTMQAADYSAISRASGDNLSPRLATLYVERWKPWAMAEARIWLQSRRSRLSLTLAYVDGGGVSAREMDMLVQSIRGYGA